jgi:hypothetical protein
VSGARIRYVTLRVPEYGLTRRHDTPGMGTRHAVHERATPRVVSWIRG